MSVALPLGTYIQVITIITEMRAIIQVILIGVGLLTEVKDRRIVKVPTVSFTDKDIGNNALCINSQV